MSSILYLSCNFVVVTERITFIANYASVLIPVTFSPLNYSVSQSVSLSYKSFFSFFYYHFLAPRLLMLSNFLAIFFFIIYIQYWNRTKLFMTMMIFDECLAHLIVVNAMMWLYFTSNGGVMIIIIIIGCSSSIVCRLI